jgi:hypothetical protein
MKQTLAASFIVCLALAQPGCDRRTPATPDPNVAPRAQWVWNPVAPIIAGQTSVLFNASASIDTDGSIARYTWDFGDGSVPLEGGATVRHTFPDTGLRCAVASYNVQLTVTDDAGGRDSLAHVIDVTELPDPKSLECTSQ